MFVLTKQNHKKDIHDVCYVIYLKHNLISVEQLMEHGYYILFKVSTCLILDKPLNKKLIAKIQMTKNMIFSLNLRSVNLSQSYAQNISNSAENLFQSSKFRYPIFQDQSSSGTVPYRTRQYLKNVYALTCNISILQKSGISIYFTCKMKIWWGLFGFYAVILCFWIHEC